MTGEAVPPSVSPAPRRTPRRGLIFASIVLIGAIVVFWRPILFLGGGGLISVGHVMQEMVSGGRYSDVDHATPEEVLANILDANQKAAWVRERVPGKVRQPQALIVMCVDPRLDARVVLGDSRDYYDVLRIPGSILSEEAIEAVELGVEKHVVKVVLITRHTDCAAEKVAASQDADHFPALSDAVRSREAMFDELLARPIIAKRIASGDLIVRRFMIDTETDRLIAE